MGSKKKKAEKKKDFVKQKLKVGKTAAKPDNHTDTSFVAKSISLPNQSLNKKTSSLQTEEKEEVDLTHHLSLTKHHSAATRKEVLNYIEQHLPSNPSLYKQILTSIIPLILDESQNVRNALVSLFKACAREQPGLLDLHVKSIILFIHSAMTHIQPDIRNSSSAFLSVLVEFAPNALSRSYFIKTLKAYFALMAWTLTNDKKSVSLAITTSSSIGGSTKKSRINHLAVLRAFLNATLFFNQADIKNEIDLSTVIQIHPQSYKYLISSTPNPFASLKLFVHETPTLTALASTNSDNVGVINDGSFTLKDLDTLSTEDMDTRRKVMSDIFIEPITRSLKNLIKEGGEVGREANSCIGVINKLNKEILTQKQNS